MIFEKEGQKLSLAEFEKLTGARYIPNLEFDSNLFSKIAAKMGKLQMSIRQVWFGKYFEKELLGKKEADVVIKWIDERFGFGVFANRDFGPMEFIAEYVGFVRQRKGSDLQNSYCFEYAYTLEETSTYTIDAMEQGGLSRYINHSEEPNLTSALATLNQISHIVLHTNRKVVKGEQLCYHYGPDYWADRSRPLPL